MITNRSYENDTFLAERSFDDVWVIKLKEDGQVLCENLVSFSQVIAKMAELETLYGPRKGKPNVFASLSHRIYGDQLARMSPEQYSEHCETVVHSFTPYRRIR